MFLIERDGIFSYSNKNRAKCFQRRGSTHRNASQPKYKRDETLLIQKQENGIHCFAIGYTLVQYLYLLPVYYRIETLEQLMCSLLCYITWCCCAYQFLQPHCMALKVSLKSRTCTIRLLKVLTRCFYLTFSYFELITQIVTRIVSIVSIYRVLYDLGL